MTFTRSINGFLFLRSATVGELSLVIGENSHHLNNIIFLLTLQNVRVLQKASPSVKGFS